jgi:hypothetical protein
MSGCTAAVATPWALVGVVRTSVHAERTSRSNRTETPAAGVGGLPSGEVRTVAVAATVAP